MPSQITITGKTGPGSTVTALVLTGVTRIEYDTDPRSVIRIYHDKGVTDVDIEAQTTWSTTLSSGNITVTIS